MSWLQQQGIAYREVPIRDTPPTVAELKKALKNEGNIRRIINTSSKDYRDLGLKQKLDKMQPEEVFSLLRENGNLVKRPFVVAAATAWAGFRPETWANRLC